MSRLDKLIFHEVMGIIKAENYFNFFDLAIKDWEGAVKLDQSNELFKRLTMWALFAPSHTYNVMCKFCRCELLLKIYKK